MLILQGHEAGKPVHGLAFAPDGSRLASCGGDRTVRLWDVGGGTSRVVADTLSHAVAFSPDGSRLVCWGQHWTTDLLVVDLASGATVTVRLPRQSYQYSHALFSRNGQTLVVVSGEVSLHDAASGEVRAVWLGSQAALGCLAMDASGTLVVTAHMIGKGGLPTGRRYDYPVRLWRYPSGQVVREFGDATDDMMSLALSPDGRWVAAASSPTLWAWDASTGAVVLRQRPDSKHFKCVAFSPDGRTLAAAHNDHHVRLYSVGEWKERETFDWKIGPIVSVCFAPDGMRAAAGSRRGRIVVWDVDP
jgi:WD40 repeat protein